MAQVDPRLLAQLLGDAMPESRAMMPRGVPVQLSNAMGMPANQNVSQAEVRGMIPPPLGRFERDWQNYFSRMHPDEVMQSEPAWGAVARAREAGKDTGTEFANYVNQAWQAMGANRYISPDMASKYIRLQEGAAKGIGPAP